jgi:transcription-repair coupling factor (superfamily II helicase)
MKSLLSALEGWAEFRSLQEGLAQSASLMRVTGLEGAAKSFVLAGAFARLERPGLIITWNAQEAARIYDDMAALLGEHFPEVKTNLLLLPSLDTLLYEDVAPDKELLRDRLNALWRIARGEPVIAITTLDGALCQTLPAEKLLDSAFTIHVGESISRDDLVEALIRADYEREDTSEGPGEFSVRGGVIDIWPSTAEAPVRIEQFGDEIESLRWFNPSTQRSHDKLDALVILPAREMTLETEATERATEQIQSLLRAQVRQLEEEGAEEAAQHLESKVKDDLRGFALHSYRRGMEYYLPYLWEEPTRVLDYLPQNAAIIVDEPERTEETYSKFLEELEAMRERRGKRGLLLAMPASHYASLDEGKARLALRPRVEISVLPGDGAGRTLVMESGPAEDFAANMNIMVAGVKQAQAQGYLVVAASRQAERLAELLSEADIARVWLNPEQPVGPGDILITPLPLSRGFKLRGINLVVYTDGELFGWKRPPRAGSHRRETVTITMLSQLKTGDYVVHINHGIGIYTGLVRKVVEGTEREYLQIDYAEGDKLFVPADQFDRVQKYIGGDGEHPQLHRLGGKDWERAKKRAKKSAEDLADELVALYAARSREEGHAFAPDTPWQHEMEAGFPYEETGDQITALRDVKEDMEKPNPMDRLVCGDVGFGKTEVAIRAAFKAIMDGKQVAVLVPTTVLAAQHYNTFRERLSPYPARVEMLSRFRSAKERTRVVAELAAGAVDLVVGTHRLLSKDVQFKDLGLLIVDEEQRFGVKHKERLKQLRATVDVLTLSATPIPRTLHMTLSGLREMSLINDPPEGRRPIRTTASPRSDALILEAVGRELERKGQVYFVHNRVESLPHTVAHLQHLLPEARIVMAHGQMPESELEKVMVDFYAGKYDILSCTTIIENGLDIPNVNTIVIDQADKLGLAQLYQLRGRVGRAERQAYAYLLWTPHKKMTEVAQQRIQAIREFSDLGSGLKLALRDLEIRGAGNLLGAEQHGFVAAVGFDLYCQLLADAVSEARGLPVQSRPEVSLDLPVDAYIPDDWAPALNHRIELYRRLAAVTDQNMLEDLMAEMRDRFGAPIPRSVLNLHRLVRIKLLAMANRIERIAAMHGNVVFQIAGPRLSVLEMRDLRAALGVAQMPRFTQVEPGRVVVPFKLSAPEELFLLVEQVLQVISKLPAREETVTA